MPTVYNAKILGDICPGSTVTLAVLGWTGEFDAPMVWFVDHVVFVEVADVPDLGTLTIGGSVTCADGSATPVGPITMYIEDSGAGGDGDGDSDPG